MRDVNAELVALQLHFEACGKGHLVITALLNDLISTGCDLCCHTVKPAQLFYQIQVQSRPGNTGGSVWGRWCVCKDLEACLFRFSVRDCGV